jgi:hypothetical protein
MAMSTAVMLRMSRTQNQTVEKGRLRSFAKWFRCAEISIVSLDPSPEEGIKRFPREFEGRLARRVREKLAEFALIDLFGRGSEQGE